MTDTAAPVPFDEDSYYQDPAGFFARLRESRPVAPVRLPDRGRAWFITRYADVRAALATPGWRTTSTTSPVAASGGRARPRAGCPGAGRLPDGADRRQARGSR